MHLDPHLTSQLKALPHPAIVAVSGLGGSGKSSLARLLARALDAPVISIDSFMTDTTRTDFHSWDVMDFDRLARDVLAPFTAGANPIHYRGFDWASNTLGDSVKTPHDGLLVVEGVGLLRPEINAYFSYRIWVDCPIDEAIARGKCRDRVDHGVANDQLWDGIWKKNDLEYFERFQPRAGADLVIDNSVTQPAS